MSRKDIKMTCHSINQCAFVLKIKKIKKKKREKETTNIISRNRQREHNKCEGEHPLTTPTNI